MIRKGSKVKVISDNENYEKFIGKTLKVIGVFKNDKEHPGYDMGVYPMKLYEFKDCPFALYEYEIEHV